jgi:hypothetical protein
VICTRALNEWLLGNGYPGLSIQIRQFFSCQVSFFEIALFWQTSPWYVIITMKRCFGKLIRTEGGCPVSALAKRVSLALFIKINNT